MGLCMPEDCDCLQMPSGDKVSVLPQHPGGMCTGNGEAVLSWEVCNLGSVKGREQWQCAVGPVTFTTSLPKRCL